LPRERDDNPSATVPFELRDVTIDEHERFVELFAAKNDLPYPQWFNGQI
jgi:hypothetical protein